MPKQSQHANSAHLVKVVRRFGNCADYITIKFLLIMAHHTHKTGVPIVWISGVMTAVSVLVTQLISTENTKWKENCVEFMSLRNMHWRLQES
jgi:uncharacterized membrane protein YecN with MAPEG domain